MLQQGFSVSLNFLDKCSSTLLKESLKITIKNKFSFLDFNSQHGHSHNKYHYTTADTKNLRLR